MSVEEFLEPLERVKRNGVGWICACPAHEDTNPSLSVTVGDDERILLHCHAGCTVAAICAARGITEADLFRPRPRDLEPETTYDYVDEAGELLFQVVRKPGKKFFQRRPDPHGGWITRLGDTRRVLYRLPAVLKVVALGFDIVYVVEGEKDVHAVERARGTATCNPGGAGKWVGKWQNEYTEPLRGATVIIVADRDEPGIKHAHEVASSLEGIARMVSIMQAAAGKDVSDHLAAGNTLAELVPLEHETLEQDSTALSTDPTVTLSEFVARKPEEDTEPLISCEHGSIAPAGALVLMGGKASGGKTTVATDLLLHAAAGVDYCGLTFARPLRILLIENEGPREGFRQKLEARLPHGPAGEGSEAIRIWDEPALWGMIRVSDDDIRTQLRDVIVTHRIDLVVSDSLTRFGMKGNGTPEETRDFMVLLADIGLGRDVAFLILAHTRSRTDNGEDEIEQLAGAWAPHADAILMLRKLDGNRARLSYPKTRWTRGTVPAGILSFDASTETFVLVATDEEQPDKVSPETYEQRILDWLEEHAWATTDELDNGVEGRATEVRAARIRLQKAGRVSSAQSATLGRPGKAMRWNTSNDAGYNPVPLPGTWADGEGSDPAQEGNPVRGVPHLRGDPARDGVPGQGADELERLLERHSDIAEGKAS